jgi:hypothetical protein
MNATACVYYALQGFFVLSLVEQFVARAEFKSD